MAKLQEIPIKKQKKKPSLKCQLKVFYDGGVDSDLDKAIESAIQPFGFKRWASSFNLLNAKRDLAFEK